MRDTFHPRRRRELDTHCWFSNEMEVKLLPTTVYNCEHSRFFLQERCTVRGFPAKLVFLRRNRLILFPLRFFVGFNVSNILSNILQTDIELIYFFWLEQNYKFFLLRWNSQNFCWLFKVIKIIYYIILREFGEKIRKNA